MQARRYADRGPVRPAGMERRTTGSQSSCQEEYRGKDAGHPAPPAQIRTCGTLAYGTDLECIAAQDTLANGCRMYVPHADHRHADGSDRTFKRRTARTKERMMRAQGHTTAWGTHRGVD